VALGEARGIDDARTARERHALSAVRALLISVSSRDESRRDDRASSKGPAEVARPRARRIIKGTEGWTRRAILVRFVERK